MNRRIRMNVAAMTIAVGLTIAGCAPDTSKLDTQLSQPWQARVVAIADDAGAGDPTTALQELATLETEAVQARNDGEISAERAAIIQQSIDVVRADLEAALPDPVAPTPEDTAITDPPESDPVDDGSSTGGDDKNNNGNENEKKDKEDKKDKRDKNDNGNED